MSIAEKPFKTYNSQMKYLRDSKKIKCDGSLHKKILITQGYFNLINGYKTPFVQDVHNGKHIYKPNTTVEHIKYVKDFDKALRIHLMHTVSCVEEEVRTLVGHKFDEVNGHGKTKWYEVESYDSKLDTQEKMEVISKCFNEIKRSKSAYVQYYLKDYKAIPTWIFVKTLNFSTFIEFLAICKDDVINSICDLYGIKNANRENDYKLLITMLHWLRKVRNACAHNERIYGIIRVKGRRMQPFKEFLEGLNAYTREKDQRIIDLLVYLRYFIEDINYKTFIEEIESMFNGLKDNIEDFPFNRVRKETGIKNIQHLEKLKEYVKNIEYNKF